MEWGPVSAGGLPRDRPRETTVKKETKSQKTEHDGEWVLLPSYVPQGIKGYKEETSSNCSNQTLVICVHKL